MSASTTRSIASNGALFVAVGDNGLIVQGSLSWPSIAQWRKVYYDTTANQGNAADAAAPQGDGVPNLLKYALGLDPRQSAVGTLPMATIEPDSSTGLSYLTLTAKRQGVAVAVSYIVEVSSDLITWKGTPGSDTVTLVNNPYLLKVRTLVPYSSQSTAFMRLRITDP
jgi:hypothetical protein